MSSRGDPEVISSDIRARLAERGVTAPTVLDRLLEALELKRDIDLASYLQVSKATISTWRSRNKIPYEVILMAYIEKKIDIIYCLTGEKIDGVYPGYHAGLELAAMVEELNRRYGSPDKWRLEPGPGRIAEAASAPDPKTPGEVQDQTDDGAQ